MWRRWRGLSGDPAPGAGASLCCYLGGQGNQGKEGISQEARLTMQQMHKQVSAMLPCPQLIDKETILIPPNNWNKFFKRLLYAPNFAPVTPKICSRFNPLHVGHVQYFELHLVLFNTQHCTWLFQSIALGRVWQGCINCGILVSGIRAHGISSEHMENMEMFSCSPT